MKCPSRRNSLPKGTVSWTSTAWYGERNFSNWRAERMKKPHSSVRYSVIAPGAMSPPAPGLPDSGIASAAVDRVEARARGLERRFERAEELVCLVGVVGRQVADVDVDGDEAVFWPRVDREVGFGEQHGAGDALRLELVERVADDR